VDAEPARVGWHRRSDVSSPTADAFLQVDDD
jgi:hypothetical protein